MFESIKLNSGYDMPMLGLGVYKMNGPGEAEYAIEHAAAIGYRLIDTASVYKNEDAVGDALAFLTVPRGEMFITTKVWNNAQRIGNVESAFERSLERLGLTYIDLYLIHWPVPGCYLETWRILEDLQMSGKIRSIGVSNFDEIQLDDLMSHARIMPAVNQIEFHPLFQQHGIRRFCQAHGIAVQAYAPLARGAYLEKELLNTIALKYNRSPAQIGLRWILQNGVSVIPKSSNLDRILENSQIFDFELDESEMDALEALNENYRSASIPEDMRDASTSMPQL